MRKVWCPWPDFFGGLDGGSVHHYLFYSQHGDRIFLGPFIGESAFVTGLTGNCKTLVDSNNDPDYRLASLRSPRSRHGDVQQKNIMVVQNANNNRNDEGGRSFDFAHRLG
jgi:hypothetical protein